MSSKYNMQEIEFERISDGLVANGVCAGKQSY